MGHNPLGGFKWSLTDAFWGAAAARALDRLVRIDADLAGRPTVASQAVLRTGDGTALRQEHLVRVGLGLALGGVGEEMLFRGVFQASFTSWWGVAWGLIVASVLFGLLHPISLPYVVVSTLLGFYLGAVWNRSGNLLTVIVAHTLYYFAALGFLIRFQNWEDEEPETN